MMESMSTRRRSTPLTQAEIVRAALKLIDQDGLDGFSMRKLGAQLGIDPMTVYRRFEDQEDLFDAVAAEMFRGVEIGQLPWDAPWTELLLAYGAALYDALLAHPNALPLYGTRPVRSQDAVEMAVRVLLKMADEGVPSPTALQVALCINEYVIGTAIARSADLTAAHRSRRPEPGSAGFNVLAAAAAGTPPGSHFELGLRALIDGLHRATLHRSE
jgi:AcrR family transcriptional regulator